MGVPGGTFPQLGNVYESVTGHLPQSRLVRLVGSDKVKFLHDAQKSGMVPSALPPRLLE